MSLAEHEASFGHWVDEQRASCVPSPTMNIPPYFIIDRTDNEANNGQCHVKVDGKVLLRKLPYAEALELTRLANERIAATNEALENLVRNLENPMTWNWTRMLGYGDQRYAADVFLEQLVKHGLIKYQKHPLGGHIWEINGHQYGRVDKDTPKPLP